MTNDVNMSSADIATLGKSAANIIDALIGATEKIHGPQPRLRHIFHLAAAEAESVLGVPAGAIAAGGAKPPPQN